MKRDVGKKGLSPVIASVLLILLVLVLAVIIFLWARGFIGEQVEKFGKPIGEYCGKVKLDLNKQGNMLEARNIGDVNVERLDVKMIKGGTSEMTSYDFSIGAGESVTNHIAFNLSDGSIPDKVIIYPSLIGSVKGSGSKSVFTCMDSGIIFNID